MPIFQTPPSWIAFSWIFSNWFVSNHLEPIIHAPQCMVINIISLLIILWFSCLSLISVILSIDQSHLIVLVSLAIVNPRWSLTKQLTTASSYLLCLIIMMMLVKRMLTCPYPLLLLMKWVWWRGREYCTVWSLRCAAISKILYLAYCKGCKLCGTQNNWQPHLISSLRVRPFTINLRLW